MRIKIARRYHENATERRRRLARERYAAKKVAESVALMAFERSRAAARATS